MNSNPQSIIYLYSKFSNNCKYFSQLLSQHKLDFIFPVCIDNKLIRNKLLKHTNSIKEVPVIFIIYENGSIEKFEGHLSLEWINQIIQNINHQPINNNPKITQNENNITSLGGASRMDDTIEKFDINKPEKRNNFEHNNKNFPRPKLPETNTNISENNIRKKSATGKPSETESKNILLQAQKMAKMREDYDIPMHKRVPNNGVGITTPNPEGKNISNLDDLDGEDELFDDTEFS